MTSFLVVPITIFYYDFVYFLLIALEPVRKTSKIACFVPLELNLVIITRVKAGLTVENLDSNRLLNSTIILVFLIPS